MVSALNLHLHLDLPRGDYIAWVRNINGFLTEKYISCFSLVKNNRNNTDFHQSSDSPIILTFDISFRFETKSE